MESSKFSETASKWAEKVFGAKGNFRLRYLHQRGHLPRLGSPKDMSEILISQMFTPAKCVEYAPFIDKVAVREYLRQKGLETCLLEHYGVWNRPEDVDFERLPNQFALKSNNGSGNHVICYDKTKLDKKRAIEMMHKAIKAGAFCVEPHYHNITPLIYAEELIDCGDGSLPVDYKFTCIGGEIMDIFVATDRATSTHYCTLDTNWNPLPYTKPSYLPKEIPARPKHLDKLIEVARILAADFDFVRVDLYEYKDRPFFSELTFFPWGCLMYSYTDEAIKIYGEKFRSISRNK